VGPLSVSVHRAVAREVARGDVPSGEVGLGLPPNGRAAAVEFASETDREPPRVPKRRGEVTEVGAASEDDSMRLGSVEVLVLEVG
jgi:hypothetical protein